MVLIGRKHQIDTLEKYAKFSSLILLYGHPYTGKSIVLQSLLQERLQGQLTVLVNGKRIYSSSDLYREILQQLRKWLDQRGLETSAEAEEEKSFIIKDIPVEELTTDDTCHSTNHSHKERSTQFSTGKSTPRKLNFINFFRLLMQTMAHFEKISSIMEHRTIYIALDHVEYLVERNVISELRRLLRINDQLNSRMVSCE
uniref:AlNc14C33G3011 protein n=1 Tax=Albugo laibachii Nc14 TaxID=890382 RepID=F0W834_9STRA|nr:AlNc14C33G3011 [Albugo laibachii Nc14]|eukprot:CCA17317.1 AlNc14C33G3011 [Albugo laibachii Nc14]